MILLINVHHTFVLSEFEVRHPQSTQLFFNLCESHNATMLPFTDQPIEKRLNPTSRYHSRFGAHWHCPFQWTVCATDMMYGTVSMLAYGHLVCYSVSAPTPCNVNKCPPPSLPTRNWNCISAVSAVFNGLYFVVSYYWRFTPSGKSLYTTFDARAVVTYGRRNWAYTEQASQVRFGRQKIGT